MAFLTKRSFDIVNKCRKYKKKHNYFNYIINPHKQNDIHSSSNSASPHDKTLVYSQFHSPTKNHPVWE